MYSISTISLRVVRIRRVADEDALALPKKTGLGEGPKQYPAHLSIKTRQPRRVSRGELYAGRINEQVLDACERLFETPCLDPPRHVRLVLAVSGDIGLPPTEINSGVQVPSKSFVELALAIAFAHRPPRRAGL